MLTFDEMNVILEENKRLCPVGTIKSTDVAMPDAAQPLRSEIRCLKIYSNINDIMHLI